MKLTWPRTRFDFSSVLVLCLLIAIAFLVGEGFAQDRTHNLGDYKFYVRVRESINTNNQSPNGDWPQDLYRHGTVVFYNAPLLIGEWVDSTGEVHTKEWRESMVSWREAPYGLSEYRKAEPPEVWVYVEGQEVLSSKRFTGEVDPTIPSDMMVKLHYKAYPGFDVMKRSYSYSNQNHNDYVIQVCRYLCTFDWDQYDGPDTDPTQTMKDVYFALGYCFQTAEGTYITYSRWYEEGKDDWADYEDYSSELVSGVRPLAISYSWDGDHPDLVAFEPGGPTFDDTGDPRHGRGSGGSTPMPSAEFVSAAYGGFAALHVDKSPSDHSDDFTQPLSIISAVNIYDVWDTDFGYATMWDWAASGVRQTVENVVGWPDDPKAKEADYPFQAFGPYNFALGDSVVIVYAVGANGLSYSLTIEKGLEWRDWYRGVAGATFDDAAKNALLATGKDSLFQTMDRAMWTWSRGLDIPDPLPAPDLYVRSGPNRIILEWEDLSEVGDFDTGVPDLEKYRIYRKLGEFLGDRSEELREDGVHIRWEFIAEVPKTQTTYIDTTVIRGEKYHYAVTAVDDGTQNTNGLFPGQKLESSKYANRSEVAAIAFQPGAETAQGVRIIPNPYVLRAGEFNFTGADDKLLIANLPPYCTIRIYTITGDLIKVIKHETGSADESWDQVTESNQVIASGVYILQVTDARNLAEESIAGCIEKFVIIR